MAGSTRAELRWTAVGNVLLLAVEVLGRAQCGGPIGRWLLISCSVGVRWIQFRGYRQGEVSGSDTQENEGQWDNAE